MAVPLSYSVPLMNRFITFISLIQIRSETWWTSSNPCSNAVYNYICFEPFYILWIWVSCSFLLLSVILSFLLLSGTYIFQSSSHCLPLKVETNSLLVTLASGNKRFQNPAICFGRISLFCFVQELTVKLVHSFDMSGLSIIMKKFVLFAVLLNPLHARVALI